MTPRRVLSELESVAARLGVAVRAEPFLKGVLDGRGGLCWVDGKPIVVMDEKLSVPDRVGVLADALAQLDVDAAEVPLHLLEMIRASKKRARPVPKLGRRVTRRKQPSHAHPGLARAKPRKGK